MENCAKSVIGWRMQRILSKLANQSLFLLEDGDDQTPAIMDLMGEVSEAMAD